MPKGPTYEIAPPAGLKINLSELRRFRGLFLMLVWRDISVRYKQTLLGLLWALLQPLATMVIFTFIFNRVAGIQGDAGTPYPVFLFVGLLIWQYFSGALSNAANSMVGNVQLIQKVYFPRVLIPAAATATGLVDLVVGSFLLGLLMVYFGVAPNLLGILLMPLLVGIAFLCSMGLGLFLASLAVKYRDVRHALPFFIQLLLYVSPVIYPAKMLDHHPQVQAVMLWFNPISGVITNARAALFTAGTIDWSVLGISFLVSMLYFLTGLAYFHRTERYFADVA